MIAILILAWVPVALLSTFGVYLYWRRVARRLAVPHGAGVAVIIPIKGAHGEEVGLDRFLATCLAQAGIDYRLVFAIESEADPAARRLSALVAQDSRVSLVVAGRSVSRGQKVHNQLAALATLTAADRFVVFADADVLLPPDWLAQLLRPILLGHAELASGYRWILPADHRLASRFCALIDWGVATAPRAQRWNVCWGGSMAISRAALDRMDIHRLWATTVVDDITLTLEARRLRVAIHAPHRVLVPSPVRHDLRSLWNFGRRQYLSTRVHGRFYWWMAGATLIVPVMGGIAAIVGAAGGNLPALAWLGFALGLQQLRASLRVRIAQRVLPAEQAAQSAALVRRDRWLLPAAHVLHVAIWLSSAVGRTMLWAGRRYRLVAPGRAGLFDQPEA